MTQPKLRRRTRSTKSPSLCRRPRPKRNRKGRVHLFAVFSRTGLSFSARCLFGRISAGGDARGEGGRRENGGPCSVQRIAVLNRAVEARASAALRELRATVRARQHA